ncbi:restriction endonuclease subunit S [Paenirhodobacter enshiensis]|uniref:restriction endonuclease subunit S n=1 Tax=Paenirhodobacter enshiensis TaxID=1105367 RepID=UPI0035B25208
MNDATVQAPKGWKAVPLADLASFRTGPFGSTFHKSDYRNGGVPLINPSHIIDGEIVPDEQVAVAPDLASRLSVFALRENDIVIGRRGDMGRCAVVRSHQAGFLCGTGSMIVRPRPGVSPELLQAFLASPKVIAKIEENSVGTTMINLNQGTLSALEILLPGSEHRQQAIAAALSDADGVVAGLERVIAKKRLIKQGAMQDLLTARRRLPGFSGEWEVKRLGSLGVCLRGVSYDGSADLFETETPDSIMLLRANNVQNGEIVYSDVQHVRKERVKPVQCLKRGDVLVCMANGSRTLVGKAGVFWDGDGPAYTFGAFMGCFRPAAGAAADGYVPFLFQSDEYRNQLNVILSGSAINNLAPSQILGFSFKMPVDHSEQQAIAAVLSDMDAEIQTLGSRLTKARAVKEGMMQILLTGRVRLV